MMKSIISSLIMVGVSLTACTERNNANSQIATIVDTTANQKTGNMKNLISIVEIPTADFSRAINFYQKILNIDIALAEMDGIKMGLFPNSGDGVVVQLIHADGYKTSADGTIVYLNAQDDLQKIADKIEANGGMIVIPKTEIGPEMGFYVVFTDSEGNKLGLHALR